MMFLNVVPKKAESTDDEEKIGNEESDLEEACILPHSPLNVDKRPITIKSPKVKYFLWLWDCWLETQQKNAQVLLLCS